MITNGTIRGSEGLELCAERALRVDDEDEDDEGIGVGGRGSTAMDVLSGSSRIVSDVGVPVIGDGDVVVRELNRYMRR